MVMRAARCLPRAVVYSSLTGGASARIVPSCHAQNAHRIGLLASTHFTYKYKNYPKYYLANEN